MIVTYAPTTIKERLKSILNKSIIILKFLNLLKFSEFLFFLDARITGTCIYSFMPTPCHIRYGRLMIPTPYLCNDVYHMLR